MKKSLSVLMRKRLSEMAAAEFGWISTAPWQGKKVRTCEALVRRGYASAHPHIGPTGIFYKITESGRLAMQS